MLPGELPTAKMAQTWSVLYLCHFGKMAGAVASPDQEYPSVHYAWATIVGWLSLFWASGSGTIEAVAWHSQDPALDCAIKLEGKHKLGCSSGLLT